MTKVRVGVPIGLEGVSDLVLEMELSSKFVPKNPGITQGHQGNPN